MTIFVLLAWLPLLHCQSSKTIVLSPWYPAAVVTALLIIVQRIFFQWSYFSCMCSIACSTYFKRTFSALNKMIDYFINLHVFCPDGCMINTLVQCSFISRVQVLQQISIIHCSIQHLNIHYTLTQVQICTRGVSIIEVTEAAALVKMFRSQASFRFKHYCAGITSTTIAWYTSAIWGQASCCKPLTAIKASVTGSEICTIPLENINRAIST